MIRLRTIGQISVHIGDKPVPATNELIIAAILYLVAERGRPTSRRALAEMFFPNTDPDAAAHSGRQLVYRLRKMGVAVDGDQASIVLTGSPEWDVDRLLERGAPSDTELEALTRGYLADFAHGQPEGFSRWLDEHRGSVTRKLREVLIRHIQSARARRDYRLAGKAAEACKGLDALNEEAVLASAESLAASGAKAEALHILDQYLDDIGSRSTDLRIAPRLLRERISTYLTEADPDSALVGRDRELATIADLIEQSRSGSTRACLIFGVGGIGKTRLLDEACSHAAITGHAIAQVSLSAHDAHRPFAMLRELGPAMLDLPGAIGASPETLAAVRGLCGRGPSTFQRRPRDPIDSQSVSADIRRVVVDLIDAIADEQPLVVRVEAAAAIDSASMELLMDILDGGRRVCLLVAARHSISLLDRLQSNPTVAQLTLQPLPAADSRSLVAQLFAQARRHDDSAFAENAIRTAAGVPLFLHLLFKNYLATGDPFALPVTLSASLTARLEELHEPEKSVFDAIVVLGSQSTDERIEAITALPRFALLRAFRSLEEGGFVRVSDGAVLPSHELLAAAARRQMPPSVARILHRAAAKTLEDQFTAQDPFEIALHWEACGEAGDALRVLRQSADVYLRLGQPRESIACLKRARELARSKTAESEVDSALFEACHAAREEYEGVAVADRLGLLRGTGDSDQQVAAIELAVGAGRPLAPTRPQLEAIARDQSTAPSIRGRAARLLMMVAEDLGDPSVASHALHSIADLHQHMPETVGARLIFETVFGSAAEAVALAKILRRLAASEVNLSSRMQMEMNSVLALLRCGEVELAIEYGEPAYYFAKEHRAWSICTSCACLLAEAVWSLEDLSTAKTWLERAQDSMNRSLGPDRAFQILSLTVEIAIVRGDISGATDLVAKAERTFPRLQSDRMGLACKAIRARIQIAAGEHPTSLAIDEMLEGYGKHRNFGGHDIVADTLIAALTKVGRLEEASAIRSEYLTIHRKDRWPVPRIYPSLRGERSQSAPLSDIAQLAK